jgi:hypothetical protein
VQQFAIALCVALLSITSPISVAHAQRTRVIVLSFEGWRSDAARRAVVTGLETSYELVDEQAAIDAAAQIGVDVSTPDGMSAVVAHLGIELVVGGSVNGRNRGATTTIWVSDIHGNELATATGPSPAARGAAADIGEAAVTACTQAYTSLHPPTPVPVETHEPPPMFEEEEEEERPGARPAVVDPNRWVMPIVRGLVGLDLRNRTAAIAPNANVSRFDADVFPTIAFQIESHPLAFLPGLENGLYLSVLGAFSAAITYTNARDGEFRPMNAYFFEGNAGYGGIIANMVEIGGTLGFGLDGVGLEQSPTMTPPRLDTEFPSTEMFYFRPAIYTRVRLFQDFVQLEGGIGGRILIGTGEIGSNQGVWDDGAGSGGGFDFNLGLGGIIAPGFSYAARFGFAGHYLSFSGGTRGSTSGTDEAFHILLLVGWAFVP